MGIKGTQLGAGKTYGTGMFHAGMSSANCGYFRVFAGLKEFAIVRICLADYSDRCTSIQKRLDLYRFWILEPNRIPFVYYVDDGT